MDTKIETDEIVNEAKIKALEGRILQIESNSSGINTNRKAIIALACLCNVILITDIDWKGISSDSKYNSIMHEKRQTVSKKSSFTFYLSSKP